MHVTSWHDVPELRPQHDMSVSTCRAATGGGTPAPDGELKQYLPPCGYAVIKQGDCLYGCEL
jgi:hypothetical protein